jgi:hypothetical protein
MQLGTTKQYESNNLIGDRKKKGEKYWGSRTRIQCREKCEMSFFLAIDSFHLFQKNNKK